MPLPSPKDLVRLSRERTFLLKASAAVTMVAVLLALLISLFATPSRFTQEGMTAAGDRESLVPLIRFGRPVPTETRILTCADLVRDGSQNLFAEEIEASLEDLRNDPSVEPVRLWWAGLNAPDPAPFLVKLETIPPETPYRDEFMGDLEFKRANHKTALRLYLSAAECYPDSLYSRRSAVFLSRFEEDSGLLRQLLDDATFRGAFEANDLLSYFAYLRDYPALARSVLATEWQRMGTAYVIPAVFTAAIWFFILLAFGEPTRGRIAKALIAFLLGLVSASLTLFAVMIQEDLFGFRFHEGDTPLGQFIYFLSGVALREESLKLLCFLPLVILLRRKSSPLEMLLFAGMTGLGFAFQENLAYFEAGAGTFTAWIRLLTANVLHFSLTGMAGYYLWRMLARGFRGWEEFLVSYLAVVFAHAIYNAIISMPSLAAYAPLNPILVAVIAYQYFDPLRDQMEKAGMHRRFSPLGIFVLGSVVLACTVLVSSAFSQPFRFALGAFVSTVGAMIPLAFAFISRFRDL
ncbi:MAG: PrsW family glutamic-type intramembrane protease [Verrucomicrobiales bacterium]